MYTHIYSSSWKLNMKWYYWKDIRFNIEGKNEAYLNHTQMVQCPYLEFLRCVLVVKWIAPDIFYKKRCNYLRRSLFLINSTLNIVTEQ